MPENSLELTYSGVLPIPDSKQLASSIIAENLAQLDLVLLNLPEAAGKVFVPVSTILVPVGRIEVQAEAIDLIRVHLARAVTPEQILRASELNSMVRSPGGAGAGKLIIRHVILGHKPGDNVNTKHYTHISMREMYALIAGMEYDLPPITKLDINWAIEQIQIAVNKKKGERYGREDMGPLNLEIYRM